MTMLKKAFEKAVNEADVTYAEKKTAKEKAQKYFDEVYTPAKDEVDKLTPVLTDKATKEEVKAAKEKLAKAEEKLAKVKDSEAKDALLATVKAYKEGIKTAEDALALEEKQTAYNNYADAVFAKLEGLKVKSSDSKTELEANAKAAVAEAIKGLEAPADAKVVVGDVDATAKTVKVKVVSDNVKIDQTKGAEQAISYNAK